MCTDNNKISQDIPCWTSNVTALFYPLNHQLLNKKTFWTARKLSGSVSSHLVSPGSMGAGAQPCPTLCCPVDCSPPGSSVHRILRARPLQWAASLLQGIFLTQGFNHCRWIFYSWATGALGLLCWVCLFSPTCWQNPTSPWPLLSSEWGPKVSIYADGLTYLDTDADAQTQPSGHNPAGHVPRPCPSTQALTPVVGGTQYVPVPPASSQDLPVTEGLSHFFIFGRVPGLTQRSFSLRFLIQTHHLLDSTSDLKNSQPGRCCLLTLPF